MSTVPAKDDSELEQALNGVMGAVSEREYTFDNAPVLLKLFICYGSTNQGR